MDSAKPIGTISLDWLKLPENTKPWEPFETEDIFATGLVTVPSDYLLTLGSGIFFSPTHTASSMATTPAYPLRSESQMYVAGRDVIRWGGINDPFEIDFDRYIFTPIPDKEIALVSKAPKSELHHFSEAPHLIKNIPDSWQDIFKAIMDGTLTKPD